MEGLTVPSSLSLRQEPKSAKRMWPFMSNKMLSGLMSLLDTKEKNENDKIDCFYIFIQKLNLKLQSKCKIQQILYHVDELILQNKEDRFVYFFISM